MSSFEWERTEEQRKVAKVLEEVAADVGAPNIQAGECGRRLHIAAV